jgi:hypothetical protein
MVFLLKNHLLIEQELKRHFILPQKLFVPNIFEIRLQQEDDHFKNQLDLR